MVTDTLKNGIQQRAAVDGADRLADLNQQISGLDALEFAKSQRQSLLVRFWSGLWPKLAAISIVLAVWQSVVWAQLKPDYVLPPPTTVFARFGDLVGTQKYWHAIEVTMARAVVGFAIAVVVGLVLGLAVARSRVLRSAVGSLITGLQTMPSIAWYPLAILLFKLSEGAILFVILIGAVPSIANGVVNGVDYVPPLLKKAGRSLGASGLSLYRHVILPASVPSIVAGLKQGWAFSWRSLMAGELLVAISGRPSLGLELSNAREFSEPDTLIAYMVTILTIGLVVDAVFSWVDKRIRIHRGLIVH
jgi:NitT/TauT family transport system permease protein